MRVAYFAHRLRGPGGHHKDVSHKHSCLPAGKVIYPRVTGVCNQRDVANPGKRPILFFSRISSGGGLLFSAPVSLSSRALAICASVGFAPATI